MNARKTDAELQSEVMSELKTDTRVDAPAIGVAVKDGVVTLSGAVESWSRRQAAQEAAHRVAGVLDVANEIQIRVPGSYARSDADVAKAVRQGLEWDTRVPHDKIRSTVTDGFVTLEGAVDFWSQREDAQHAVSYLVGVKGVVNNIAVAPPKMSEEDVKRSITEALARQARREARHVEVEVHDGRVTVTGSVHSWAERRAIVGSAGATHGVRSVDDRLRVEPWT